MMRLSILVFLFFPFLGFSQQPRCQEATEELTQRQQKVNAILDSYRKKQKNFKVSAVKEILKIPVVVHIIRNTESEEIGGTNISNKQVFSQIKVLNQDFRKAINSNGYNDSPVGADLEIEFYLAIKDPQGVPTNGINRVYSSRGSFNTLNESASYQLSELSYWPSDRYLNIWVANLSNNSLGRAEFPGAALDGLEVSDPDEKIDGVIVHYEVFGSQVGSAIDGLYSHGRTTTHEVGHWLGLIHTWGDTFCGDDYVADTPQIEKANLTSSCNERFSDCTDQTVKNMVENYMDYSPDICMNIFTQGQKERVYAALELSQRRKRLVETAKLNLPSPEYAVTVFPNPGKSQEMKAQVLQEGFGDFTLRIYSLNGILLETTEFIDVPSTTIPLTQNVYANGQYICVFTHNGTSILKRVIFY